MGRFIYFLHHRLFLLTRVYLRKSFVRLNWRFLQFFNSFNNRLKHFSSLKILLVHTIVHLQRLSYYVERLNRFFYLFCFNLNLLQLRSRNMDRMGVKNSFQLSTPSIIILIDVKIRIRNSNSHVKIKNLHEDNRE